MDEEHLRVADPPAGGRGEAGIGRRPFWKRGPVIVVGTLLLGGLFYFGLRYLARSFTHETTDDAFIAADVVSIAPRVAGQVVKVEVADNQHVKAGDVLVKIDPQDYAVQLAQKQAALAASEANVKLLLASLNLLGAQVSTAEATARESEAEAVADEATADKADSDLKRAESLIANQTISPQEYVAAKAAAAAANATLKAGREKAASDRAKITEARAQLEAGRRAWERAQAQAKQSAVDVQQADLNLSYATITAPRDGRVTRKAVEPGDYAEVGQKLMALVSDKVWVTANFKETDLARLRTNQPATIWIDSVAGRSYAGHVQSVQAGSGAAFSLLPPENAVGNYVKVVQRVPVKIVFDSPPDAGHVLGPGMSTVPSVRVTAFEIPDAAVAVAAGMLALAVGILWWRKAGQPPPAP